MLREVLAGSRKMAGEQGLKPDAFLERFAARLKSCPDTKRLPVAQKRLYASLLGAQKLIHQGLKPAILLAFIGTSELVPFQNSPCAVLP
jgi:hypothetical protein